MAQRGRHAVGGVSRRRSFFQPKLLLYHESYLVLSCVSVPHDGLLDLAGGVLGDNGTSVRRCEENRSARVPKLERALHVLALEHVLDRDRERLVALDELPDGIVDLPNAFGESLPGGRPYDATFPQLDRPAGRPNDDPVPGNGGAWIDPEDDDLRGSRAQRLLHAREDGLIDVGVRMHLLNVVRLLERIEKPDELLRILTRHGALVLGDASQLG